MKSKEQVKQDTAASAGVSDACDLVADGTGDSDQYCQSQRSFGFFCEQEQEQELNTVEAEDRYRQAPKSECEAQAVIASYVSSVLCDDRNNDNPLENTRFDSMNPRAEIGELLKRTRCVKSMTLAEVADQTNINRRYLQALEAGRSTQLAATYERGYLHNYAEFLGLESVHLVAIWSGSVNLSSRHGNASATGESAGKAIETLNKGRVRSAVIRLLESAVTTIRRRDDKPAYAGGFRIGSSWSGGAFGSPAAILKATTSAALPLLMLCVVAFAYHALDSDSQPDRLVVTTAADWQQNKPDKLGPLAHEAVAPDKQQKWVQQPVANVQVPRDRLPNARTLQAVPTAILSSDDQSATGSPIQTTDATMLLAANDINAMGAALAGDRQLTDSAPRDAETVVPQVRPSGVLTLGEVQHANSALTVPSTDIEDSFEPVGPGAVEMISQVQMADRLVITVYEDSWVDVRDRQGARLYRDLARAGRRIDVSGKLPFSLHIGNAPGLELELNGKPVEITRYRSDNSARLTLASN